MSRLVIEDAATDTVICTITVRCMVPKTGASLENAAEGGVRRKGCCPLRTQLSYRGYEKHRTRMKNAAWLPSRTAAQCMIGEPKETLMKKGRKAVQQKPWQGLGGDEGFIRGDIDVYHDA